MQYDFAITDAALADRNHTLALQFEFIGRDKDVLELGCATGRVTRYLTEHLNCCVTGVEYDPQAAALAQPYCQRLIVGDLEAETTLRQTAGVYDVILAGDVLEHLREPARVMAALRGSLKPGGTWVISVPNVAHWSVRKELLRGRFDFTDTGVMDRTHLRWFTVKTLSEMIERAGCAVKQIDAVYTVPLQDQLRLRGLARWLQRRRIAPGFLGIQLVAQAAPKP
jgi:2-polyprenyl-3-methyl-5-hydroxy-6-metoxy-1,4-benzoquinol methylase